MEQNEIVIDIEDINYIFYNPIFYSWYIVNKKGDPIKIDSTEIIGIIAELVNSFPDKKWIAKPDESNNLVFKELDTKNEELIADVQLQIKNHKDELQEIQLEINKIRENAKINSDPFQEDKIVPLQQDMTRIMNEIDKLVAQLRRLKQNQ